LLYSLSKSRKIRRNKMNIITFLLVGLCAGFIAGKLIEGHGFGAVGDILIGVIGAFVGGYFFNGLGLQNGTFLGAVVTSTFGAMIFLVVAGLFQAVVRPRRA
jgi:uncharacterized membrane protein YeaQ/YmgE (transglycosylase-associated protein family)